MLVPVCGFGWGEGECWCVIDEGVIRGVEKELNLLMFDGGI